MKADMGLSLAHHFADLADPRIDRSRLHERLAIVAIAICAVVAGAGSAIASCRVSGDVRDRDLAGIVL